VKFAFIDAEKAEWPIEVQCQVLGVSRSGYYAWKGRPEAPRAAEDAKLVVEIKAAHKAGRGNYGSPRVHRELRAKGRRVGKKRVERLMRQEGIAARKKRRFRKTTDSNHPHPIAQNVLERNFDVELPNIAWVTDVTYVWTHEGWLYLAVILDLFSRRVVGWAASANNDRALAISALDRATSARMPEVGLDSPLRPRERVRQRGLRRCADEARSGEEHEPEGRLLGQRSCGELLCHHQR